MKYFTIVLIILVVCNIINAQDAGIDIVAEFEDYYLFEAIDAVDTLVYVATRYGLSVWIYNENNIDVPPREISRYASPGMSEALIVSDTLCYLADGYNGLLVLSVTDPANIYEVGHCPEATNGQYMILDNDIIYMACFRSGIRTVDVSDITDPVLLDTYGQCRSEDIRLTDNYLFSVSEDYHDVFIFNVSDPSDIQLINQIEVEDNPEGIEVHDGCLYAVLRDRLMIMDINDPRDIEIIYESNVDAWLYGAPAAAKAVRYFGDGYLYVGLYRIWNVRNPREAEILYGNNAGAHYVELGHTVSHVPMGSPGICINYYIYNIEDPENIERIHWLPAACGLSDVFIQDNYLYVSSRFKYGSKFDIYDIEDIHNPMKIGEIDSTVGNDHRVGYDNIYVQDDIAVLSEWRATSDSLYIFSIENIEHPREVSRMGLHSVRDLKIDGEYIYAGNDGSSAGFIVISISDPQTPEIVWQYIADNPNDFKVYGVALSNSYAYSVSRSRGGEWEENFRVWNRSDPEDLQLVGSCVVEGFEATIAVSGEYAYVTGVIDRGLLSVVSIADPENPELVFTIRLPDYGRDCIVSDGYLYISYSNLGFEIFDLEDPERPELIAHYDTPITIYYYNQLAVVDGYVITPGIIYDCARVTGRWNVELSAESYDFGVLHLNSDSTFQLTIINLAQQPVDILDISSDSAAFSVDFDEAFIIAAGEDAEVNITFTPTEERQYNGQLTIHTERRDLTVDLSGTGVNLGVDDEDIFPLEFALYNAYPNPFNNLTRIHYTLDKPGFTTLSIFDITGREAVVLREGYMKPGAYSILWNGENMPSGVYFCHLVSIGRERVVKVVLMR